MVSHGKKSGRIGGFVLICRDQGRLTGQICEAVINLLDTVQEFGTETLDAINANLRRQIASTAERRESITGALEEARRNLDQRRSQRQAHIDEQQKIRDEAEAELEQLKKRVREAKDAKAAAVEAAWRELEAAEHQKAELIERKRAEYQEELQKARNSQQELADQERELKHERFTLYGKVQQEVEAALKNYKDQDCIAEAAEQYVRDLEWKIANGNLLEKGEAIAQYPFAQQRAFAAKASAEVFRGLWELAARGLKSSGCDDLATQIANVTGALVHASQALDKLIEEGESGFIREMLNTEERKVAEARSKLQRAQDDNSHLTQVVQEAIYQLNTARGPELYRVIAQADEGIRRAKEDAELGQLEEQVRAQVELEADVQRELQKLHDAVEWTKQGFRQGAEEMKDIIRSFQKIMFRITGTKVSASAGDMADGKSLSFAVTGVFDGRERQLVVEWSPLNTIHDFYQAVLKQVLAL
ncbi:hypothetical protein MMYC01_205607 [Madurella mycetomatis]|uniref:Uncharacterized protein n=1 Tax=Madurella mycetomatis TaxID=100816 RepID=A0A175W0B5_9PEZI|nr:hypothetical protein MMYC01_205607 [Madurella mycetomatis]